MRNRDVRVIENDVVVCFGSSRIRNPIICFLERIKLLDELLRAAIIHCGTLAIISPSHVVVSRSIYPTPLIQIADAFDAKGGKFLRYRL